MIFPKSIGVSFKKKLNMNPIKFKAPKEINNNQYASSLFSIPERSK